MKIKLLIAALAFLGLPIFAAATNYDVSIEQSADRYMCLDSTTGTYFVKLGTMEFAGHSVLYTHTDPVFGRTFVEMYASVIMCTGQFEPTKKVGMFTVHGWKDQKIVDLTFSDSGFCAVANKPPEINYVFATVPKFKPGPTNKNMMTFQVKGQFIDDNAGLAGLEWKLESSCFATVEGTGFVIDKKLLLSPDAKNCKIKLTVEDAHDGYAFSEFYIPSNKPDVHN